MKNVFIIGARGYHVNYGGWETFVSQLVDNYHDNNTHFYISSIVDTKQEKEIVINENITINPIYTPNIGSAKMFLYSLKAYDNCLKYIKKNNVENPYVYVLGLKQLYLLALREKFCKKNNIKVFVNPDGLEWMRSKWSKPIKKFFLLAEKMMLNHCDLIICDGLGIQKYVCEKYPHLTDKTTYIAYGSNQFDFSKIDQETILKKYNLKRNDYCLMVGRFVPENNYELVIKDFMKSKINKKLVIVSNISSNNYYAQLQEKTNCESDKRIVFINGIYNQDELAAVRNNAFLYIHGHSVGGTNPSLIESLSITNLNVLYDVCFNHDVGLDSCLYFKNENDLTKILDDESKLEKLQKELGPKAKEIVSNNFTWQIIVDKYKELFK